MTTGRTIIIGGGIAGLAAGWQLARRGVEVVVVERESLTCSHSSGRNAAIFRHAEPIPSLGRLALRSRTLLDELLGGNAWLTRRGALYVAPVEEPVASLALVCKAAGVSVSRVDGDALIARQPALRDGSACFGLLSPEDGVMDVHAITDALRRAGTALGVVTKTGAGVANICCADGRVVGVRLESGDLLLADCVVIAAGAWAAELGAAAGAALPLSPLRRHLALLDGPCAADVDGPVVWRILEDAYFRPEGQGVLASPCDEEQSAPCLPASSPDALNQLAERLSTLAPRLATATVRRYWAGLRTFAPDRNLVVGRDPRVRGLSWLAGLGGHGMTLAVAAAEHLTRELVRESDPLPEWSPARLLAEGSS
ncbi:MAG: NAD(P)/FAD-dependent oxidoreductase [Myxococcota bacterium]